MINIHFLRRLFEYPYFIFIVKQKSKIEISKKIVIE